MLGADVTVREALGLLRRISEHALALVRERQIDRRRDLLANGGVTLDLLADRFDRGVRAQKTIGQGFVFAQEPEQEVLGLDIRRPELTGFIARKKDDAPGFLCITFKHNTLPP